MCGIFGIIGTNAIDDELIEKYHSIQSHRGPDGKGSWQGKIEQWNITLGHQRLSIIDLSDSGAQPMASQDKGKQLIFNGELYNYIEIRDELKSKGIVFTTKTDTEVVLNAFNIWGVDASLKKFNGMWSLAYLDRTNRKLYFSRDRTGEKPLYYFRLGKQFVFASEIKTILNILDKKLTLNMNSVSLYLRQALLNSSNETFFNDIKQHPAATYSTIDLNSRSLKLEITEYWRCPVKPEVEYSENELKDKIREILHSSVKLRTRSDVPVGVLLSGGIDSSAISALIGKYDEFDREITLLSAVSNDKRYDESHYIDIVGNYLNKPINKVHLDLNENNALTLLDEITWYNDEPVGSFSNVAHYLLMKKAKELGVTVILSGQGADELFCGYKKYLGFYIQWLIRKKKYFSAINVLSSFALNNTILGQFNIAEAKRYLPFLNKKDEYEIMGSAMRDHLNVNIGLESGMDVPQRQCEDLSFYSVPALNHYEDRMSMAASREIRLPFLDYRLIDLVVPLDIKYKLRNGWTKYILRKSVSDILPNEITWRKDKQGFVNPQSEWMKYELRGTIEDYFSEDSYIFRYDILKRKELITMFDEYCNQKAGKGRIWFRDIFSPLALEVWLRKYENYITA